MGATNSETRLRSGNCKPSYADDFATGFAPGAKLMADKIRIAILGCGAITRSAHLQTVLLHPDVELVALVDTDLKGAGLLAGSLGAKCQIVADYHSVLGDVDAIINALPNNMHAVVNQGALSSGVHVLCEKPLATTTADALASCELA